MKSIEVVSRAQNKEIHWQTAKNTPENEPTSPENPWLEDAFPTEIGSFLRDMLVFGGCRCKSMVVFFSLLLQPAGKPQILTDSGLAHQVLLGHQNKRKRRVTEINMGVSKNRGTPKSSILIGFSIINHPFWGTTNFWKHPYASIFNVGK